MIYKEKCIILLKTLTALHAGSGTDLCTIDLPIQREVHTGYPKIEASTLKGCMKSVFEQSSLSKDKINTIFGTEGDGDLSAAALAITDARLLFFPVRSAKGVYALITCPMVLTRFQKDMKMLGQDFSLPNMDKLPIICSESNPIIFKDPPQEPSFILEEYSYKAVKNENNLTRLKRLEEYLKKYLKEPILDRAVILSDDDFKDFVTYSTSIVTRIKIGANGVAENQALFTEEYLPEESILYSLMLLSDSKNEPDTASATQLMTEVSNTINTEIPTLQIGADITLGKGFVQTGLIGSKTNA